MFIHSFTTPTVGSHVGASLGAPFVHCFEVNQNTLIIVRALVISIERRLHSGVFLTIGKALPCTAGSGMALLKPFQIPSQDEYELPWYYLPI